MNMGPTPTELNRLRWQCRRGLLENDLILEKFLERHGASLSSEKLDVFRSLLQLGDNELWDILSGRVDCTPDADPAVRDMIGLLRAC
jgi:antitoxin CptB